MKSFAFLAALVLAAGGSDAFADNHPHDPMEGLSEDAQAEIEEMVENGDVNPEDVQELVEDAISEAMEHMEASHAAHQAIDEARDIAHDAARDAVVAGVQSRLHGESFRAFLDMLALDRPRPASGRGPRATEVRVLGAADDTIFRVADVEATAAAWGTEAVIVPGIGHDVMLDHGCERVADQVITWVREMA